MRRGTVACPFMSQDLMLGFEIFCLIPAPVWILCHFVLFIILLCCEYCILFVHSPHFSPMLMLCILLPSVSINFGVSLVFFSFLFYWFFLLPICPHLISCCVIPNQPSVCMYISLLCCQSCSVTFLMVLCTVLVSSVPFGCCYLEFLFKPFCIGFISSIKAHFLLNIMSPAIGSSITQTTQF